MPDLLRTALRAAALLALALGAPLRAQTPPDAPALYQQHCAACHGAQRTGLMGPALLPESLERTRPAEVLRVIREGRQAAHAIDKHLMGATSLPR